MKKYWGEYILMIEGSIPTKDEAYCCVGGKSAMQIVEECAEGLPAADENEIVRTVQRTGVLLVVGIVGIPAYILPAPLVDTPDLLTQTIHNVLVLQRIGEGALAVGFKKGQLFSGWGNVRYHCVGGKGCSV